jgi:hypothetical protein
MHDLYFQCLTQTLSKTTSFTKPEGVHLCIRQFYCSLTERQCTGFFGPPLSGAAMGALRNLNQMHIPKRISDGIVKWNIRSDWTLALVLDKP